MSTYHAVAWLDHEQAHVLHFDREHVEAGRVRAHSHHKHQGAASDQGAFFAAIWQALADSHEILVCGPGSARGAFVQWVQRMHPREQGRILDSIAADHPSDGELAALARRFFARRDALGADPALR
jgi:stalled ribosome rescue protein Dom34